LKSKIDFAVKMHHRLLSEAVNINTGTCVKTSTLFFNIDLSKFAKYAELGIFDNLTLEGESLDYFTMVRCLSAKSILLFNNEPTDFIKSLFLLNQYTLN